MKQNNVSRLFFWAYQQGLVQSHTEDEALDGAEITLRGKKATNFASCSYLGLEQHPRLKEAAKDAVDRFGVQFSMSRAFLSLGLYERLESLLQRIFGAPVLVLPSTTLAHFSALPTLVRPKDLVLYDQNVHNSVQMAVQVLSARGTQTQKLAHNDIFALERQLTENPARDIWFLTDGIFSMSGDFAPMKDLKRLAETYSNLRLYVDDAHGMSWTGARGSGFALQGGAVPARSVIALSMAKAFGVTGGILVFASAEDQLNVRAAGETVIFSGPLTPPCLAAAIASAELHLEEEFTSLQQELSDRIDHFNLRAQELNLPLRSTDATPIRYLLLGDAQKTMHAGKALLDRGFYLNVCSYPAVTPKDSGLRLTLTRSISFQEIDRLLGFLKSEILH